MMEDKKTALALFLCFIIVVMYSELFLAPDARKHAQIKAAQQIAEQSQQKEEVAEAMPQVPSELSVPEQVSGAAKPIHANKENISAKAPNAADYKSAGTLKVDIGNQVFGLTLLGGRIAHATLSQHSISLESEEPYDLVSVAEGQAYPLGVYTGAANDLFTKYTVKQVSSSFIQKQNNFHLADAATGQIELIGNLNDGTPITKILTFTGGSYYFAVDIQIPENKAKNKDVWVEWTEFISEEDVNSRLDPKQFSVLDSDNSIESLLTTDEELSTGSFVDFSGAWAALGGKYFTTALVPSVKGRNILIGRSGNNFITRVRGAQTGGKYFAYAGPKVTSQLQKAGVQLERSIDLGFFSVLAHPLLWLLKFFYGFLGNYGLAIIALTLFIKILFLPLTKVQFKSMRAMQELAPEIKALKARIKDPSQLNSETMALYKKRGVNPMGGCIPMVIQLPVFLGLYNALLNYVALRHAPFALWITDLSAPEGLELFGIGVPVMIILMGLSMIAQQWTNPTAGDPAQKKAMMMVPVVFTVMFIVFPFPSGLVLYWLVNNVISIIQQTILRKERKVSPLQATLVASVAIFALGYVLTLI